MPKVELVFDADAHSADALQRAAYRFCDRFSFELQRSDAVYRCVLHSPNGQELDEPTIADFRTEVLDQVLRERIRQETEDVRNLILALAFSRTHFEDE